MLGKLTWEAIPFYQPLPLYAMGVVGLVILIVLGIITRKGWWPYLWREWLTSVDHKRIGVMYVALGLVMLLRGFSANFSGDCFSEMRFVGKSVSAGDFNSWLERVRSTGSALDDAGYAELAKPSRAVPPTTYRSVEPKLFEHIIDQTLAGPGKAGTGGASSAPPSQTGG